MPLFIYVLNFLCVLLTDTTRHVLDFCNKLPRAEDPLKSEVLNAGL